MFVPAVLAADLLLAMSARDLGAGLLALLLWGRVLPALAGLERGKVNWKVPPIARVCGVSRLGEEKVNSKVPSIARLCGTFCAGTGVVGCSGFLVGRKE